MIKFITSAAVATVMVSSAALAQTTTAPTTPAAPMNSPAATGSSTTTMTQEGMTLTDQQAKNWVSKAVYSSDGKDLGTVSEIKRDASGRVSELDADIGGFLGLGQTRVSIKPSQFHLQGDRVVLTIPSDQAKSLPKADATH